MHLSGFRFISPLGSAAAITLVGLGLYELGFPGVRKIAFFSLLFPVLCIFNLDVCISFSPYIHIQHELSRFQTYSTAKMDLPADDCKIVFFSRYYSMLIMYVSHITVVFRYQEQWNFILLNFVLLRNVCPSIIDQILSL